MGGSLDQDTSLGPSMSVSGWLLLTLLCPTFLLVHRGIFLEKNAPSQ